MTKTVKTVQNGNESIESTEAYILESNLNILRSNPKFFGVSLFCCSGNQQRANEKECILVIDRVTGEITLEKLSSQIRVKKTRQEKPDRHQQQFTQVQPAIGFELLGRWGA